MSNTDKTIFPRMTSEFDHAQDITMPGKRDRKPDGRFSIGDLIMNRYKVLAELGQGGMGVVYKCFDETAGIEVALKALPPELSHNTLEMEDIKDNFQLIHNLHHPNIAGTNNLEKDKSNGNYYLIMECCEGDDLRYWIKQKRKENDLGPENIFPIIRQIAEALDYAHEMKIMHRDIKPGNIMIDSCGKIKILDFGLAAQIHTSMTRVSMAYHGTSGTGPYMAPEQWEGRVQDARADQYALAVMAYEMFSGHLPFESSDAAVLREAVLKSKAVPLKNIPKTANAAILRAMSKESAKRFSSCLDFAAALEGKNSRNANFFIKDDLKKWIAAGIILVILLGTGIGYHFTQEKRKGAPSVTLPQTPAANPKSPVQIIQTPVASSKTPAVNPKSPTQIIQTPVASSKTPAVNPKSPVQIIQTPVASSKTPAQIPGRIKIAEKEKNQPVKVKEDKKIEADDRKREEAIAKDKQRAEIAARKAKKEQQNKLNKENAALKSELQKKITEIRNKNYEPAQTFKEKTDKMERSFSEAEKMANPIIANGKYIEAKKWADWILLNGPLRETAKNSKLNAHTNRIEAEKYEPERYARNLYQKAIKNFQTAEELYNKTRFSESEKSFKTAADFFVQAKNTAAEEKLKYLVTEAKKAEKAEKWSDVKIWAKKIRPLNQSLAQQFEEIADHKLKVEKQLISARNFKAEKIWQSVYEYAVAALNIDSTSKEAKKLKAESEENLKPKLEIIATVAGKRVPAEVKFGNKTFHTQSERIKLSLNNKYNGILTYRTGEIQYIGELEFVCNWNGPKTITVALQKQELSNIDCGNGLILEMVKIPSGYFLREDETIIHLTQNYWIGKYEVTQAQYSSIMGNNPSHFKGKNHPVEKVNWYDAKKFCEKLNEKYSGKLPKGYYFDLPTEAQWEYACRAGTTTNFSYGNASDAAKTNYDGNCPYGGGSKGPYRKKTVEVGSLGYKNAFGICDMHGNVWEWCRDRYGAYTRDTTDPTGPLYGSGRVIRGGSWDNDARRCRSSNRYNWDSEKRVNHIGFRVALVPTQDPLPF